MSLKPAPIGPIPAETMRVARRAFPKGSVAIRLRDEFGSLYQDQDFQALFPTHGQPGLAPWRLALITVLQFLENLSDRQAAEAVRARIDWKYALGLEWTDPGFHFSVLTEFRARFVAGAAEQLLLDRLLAQFQQRGLVKARGKQRTDSTHVLAAVHSLHAAQYPELPKPLRDGFTFPGGTLVCLIEKTLIASTESANSAGALLKIGKDSLTMAATDGHRLALASAPLGPMRRPPRC